MLCALCSPLTQAASDASIAGMVLDVQGGAQLLENGNTGALKLLAYLKPNMQIKLAAGSKASVTLYANRSVYQLSGPALVEISKEQIKVLQGESPKIKAMPEKLAIAAQANNDMPGAYRMRAIAPQVQLLKPQDRSVLFDTQPEFCWEAAEAPAATNYTFSLQTVENRVIAQGDTTSICWRLPEGRALNFGQSYRWSVSYLSVPDNKRYQAEAKFSLPSQSEFDYVTTLRPVESAPIEDWVMYANMLQNKQMREAARLSWKFIFERRPDLQKAQDLAK